jgi:hypothetical protein
MLDGQLIDWWNLHRIAIMFIIIGAFWRRWFGGGLGRLGDVTRFWKYLLLFQLVLGMFYYLNLLTFTEWRVYGVMIAFAIHWALSHGDYYQVLDKGKDEGRVKWIDWVLRRLYGENGYYNFKGNVTGLVLRYTSTACLVAVCLPNAWFILAGPATALCYAVMCKLPRPQDRAEYLSGAVNFGLLYYCIGG